MVGAKKASTPNTTTTSMPERCTQGSNDVKIGFLCSKDKRYSSFALWICKNTWLRDVQFLCLIISTHIVTITGQTVKTFPTEEA